MAIATEKRVRGFTLIELVMVTLLLSLLAAVAIPNFIDFRTDAKNSSTKGLLGSYRSAVAIAVSAIALRETQSTYQATPKLRYGEVLCNQFLSAVHPVLAGTAIFAPSTGGLQNPKGIVANPWSYSGTTHTGSGLTASDIATTFQTDLNTACGQSVSPASGGASDLLIASHFIYESTDGATNANRLAFYANNLGSDVTALTQWWGWAYNETSGEFWANTANNGATDSKSEFWY